MPKRIVVTGMSVNTAIGDTLDGFREALMAGRSAISQWKAFPTERVYSKVGGDLSGDLLCCYLRRLGCSRLVCRLSVTRGRGGRRRRIIGGRLAGRLGGHGVVVDGGGSMIAACPAAV